MSFQDCTFCPYLRPRRSGNSESQSRLWLGITWGSHGVSSGGFVCITMECYWLSRPSPLLYLMHLKIKWPNLRLDGTRIPGRYGAITFRWLIWESGKRSFQNKKWQTFILMQVTKDQFDVQFYFVLNCTLSLNGLVTQSKLILRFFPNKKITKPSIWLEYFFPGVGEC